MQLNGVFNISDSYIDNMKNFSNISYKTDNFTLVNNIDKCKMKIDKSKVYKLSTKSQTDSFIKALIEISGNLKQTVNNDEYNATTNNWVKAEWETPAYSVKTKKFTCDKISYNATTGRVNYIKFREL